MVRFPAHAQNADFVTQGRPEERGEHRVQGGNRWEVPGEARQGEPILLPPTHRTPRVHRHRDASQDYITHCCVYEVQQS